MVMGRRKSERQDALFVTARDLPKSLKGKTVGVDSTTLEAGAAMKSIVRRDTGEDWQTYVTGLMRAEPKRHTDWTWTDKSLEHQRAEPGNRQRVWRRKGKWLQRRRSEVCERTFAHVCDTGGMRRTWLKGLIDVTKRYVIAAAAHNLGRVLRTLFGVGKSRALQGRGGRSAGDFTAGEWAPPHLNPPRWRARLPDWLTRAPRHHPHAAVVLVV